MSGAGHSKRPERSTRKFDSAELVAQTRKPADHEAPAEPELAISRTQTLEDPMTTQLLAEVARRSKTTEFDDQLIAAAVENATVAPLPETPHPHTRRRDTGPQPTTTRKR